MEDFLYHFLLLVVLIIYLLVMPKRPVSEFRKRNSTLFNVLKAIALLFLFYRAIKTNIPSNYSFAIFYGLLAMIDTYMTEKAKKEKKKE
jgi:hypothetical protein